MAGKLRAILNGHKGAVTRIFKKVETTQREEDTHLDEIQATEESLKRKLQTFSDLHEKIIDILPEENLEEIEAEVMEQEEYIHSLNSKRLGAVLRYVLPILISTLIQAPDHQLIRRRIFQRTFQTFHIPKIDQTSIDSQNWIFQSLPETC